MTWSHSRGIHLPHRLVDGDAGVVDQDVHVPVPVEDLAEDAEDVLVVAHVALVDAHAPVGVLVGELPGVVVPGRVAGRHRDAAVEQPLADGQPDAAGPAGDHRDLPVHVTHGVPPMLPVCGPESAGHVLARGIRDGLVPPAAHGRRRFAFACPGAGPRRPVLPPRAAVLGGRSAPGLGTRACVAGRPGPGRRAGRVDDSGASASSRKPVASRALASPAASPALAAR